MTITQAQTKIRKITRSKDFKDTLDREVGKLLTSYGVDLASYDNDYRLPKIILCVALTNLAWQYKPLSTEDNKVVKNLRSF